MSGFISASTRFSRDAYLTVGMAATSGLLAPDAARRGVRPVAWFDSKQPLRSGWAWGQHYLADGVAAAEAKVGKGKVFPLGPEITFRAQPHGTFKFLFNGIYYGTSVPAGAGATTTTIAQQ